MLQRFRGPLRTSLVLSTLVAATLLPQAAIERDAMAETSEKRKVAVGRFEGGKSGAARGAFIEALKQDGSYEVTDAEDVKASAKAAAIADAAKSLGVNVVITGKIDKSGLKLKVMNGADGSVIDEVEIQGAGGKLKGNIEKEGASVVAAAIGAAKVEETKPEETPAEEAPAEATAEASAEVSGAPSGEGLSPFDVTAGLRPTHRTFEFHDTIADNRPNDFVQLFKYELPLGPALFIDLNWYPGSHFTTGPAEWFGLTAGFEKAFATESVYLEGKQGEQTLKTNSQQWYLGGRFRLPLGAHQLGAAATFGQHSFILEGDSDQAPLIPDVKYTNVRVGIDGSFRFGDFLAGARIGKRLVLDTGGLQSVWFKEVKTDSLEAGVTLGYRLTSNLDLVAGLDWLRYAFDFNPVEARKPGFESAIAGGAVDEYLTGHIAFRFHLPGAGEAAPSSGGE